jgi:hypothetical protein
MHYRIDEIASVRAAPKQGARAPGIVLLIVEVDLGPQVVRIHFLRRTVYPTCLSESACGVFIVLHRQEIVHNQYGWRV